MPFLHSLFEALDLALLAIIMAISRAEGEKPPPCEPLTILDLHFDTVREKTTATCSIAKSPPGPFSDELVFNLLGEERTELNNLTQFTTPGEVAEVSGCSVRLFNVSVDVELPADHSDELMLSCCLKRDNREEKCRSGDIKSRKNTARLENRRKRAIDHSCARPNHQDPIISFDTGVDLDLLIHGDSYNIICTDKLPADGVFEFRLKYFHELEVGGEALIVNKTFPESDSMVTREDDVTIANCDLVVGSARLLLLLKRSMQFLTIKCCTIVGDVARCAETYPLDIKCPQLSTFAFESYRYDTTDMKDGVPYPRNCTGPMDKDSRLYLAIKYSNANEFTVFGSKGEKYTYTQTVEKLEGDDCPVKTINFEVRFVPSLAMKGARLSCCRAHWQRRQETCSRPIIMRPKCPTVSAPVFTITYPEPYVVYYGQDVGGKCAAHVGPNHVVYFEEIDTTIFETIKSTFYYERDEEYKILKREPPLSPNCTLERLFVELHLILTPSRHAHRFACCVEVTPSDLRCSYAPTVFPIFIPQEPVLEVKYHNTGGQVLPGEILTAICKADVGRNGALSWVLFRQKMKDVWTIDLLGRLKGRKERGITITHFPAEAPRAKNPWLNSTLSILVTADLHGARLACYSHDVSKTKVSDIAVDPLRQISLPLAAKLSDPPSSSWNGIDEK
ncbi:hypothetical protein RRG08_019339 [Elysia crispata]|uniref:Uncharacterized protein n=1 Tax=Elysia crispata TaxID=231223 RepID=A0AAE0Z630_9GAST|nr:hypothetical protein RRG08_019339 [Elysia crispata]